MNKTKRKIFETSMKLFAEKGYDATSIEEITANVGVAKGTLYYHFTSKEEIFNFLIEEGIKLLQNSIDIKTAKLTNYIDKLKAIVLIEIKVVVKYENLITILLSQFWGKEARHQRCKQQVYNYIGKIENIVKEGIEKGEIKQGNPEVIASEIYGLISSVLVYKLRQEEQLDVMRLYHEFEGTVINGLKIEKKDEEKMKFTDLKDMLNQTEEMYKDRPAFKFKTDEPGKLRIITHKEYRDQIKALGTALIDMGLKDERIAVISENRYEWGLAYLSIATGTGVVVPLDRALPPNEIESLIMRSEVKAIFYSSKYNETMDKIREAGNSKIKYFISMDLDEKAGDVYSQKELLENGRKLLESGDKRFIDAKIDSEKMGIMLFTSGTTSISKAVMLSHKNIVTNVMDIRSLFELNETDTLLSFLPLHHVFECTVGFLYAISIGASIAFCDGVKYMVDNLKEYGVTGMISVPAVFDIMYRKLIKGIEKKGKLETVKKGIKISQALLKVKIDIRKKLFAEIHENLGGKLRLLVAGGAALDPETEKGFNELGFNLVQGYGLTETAPVIAAELTNRRRLGSIGKCFPSVEVKIHEPDEKVLEN